ncbi:MAG: HEAT repeat domain-containing protein [Pirellulales bacterium]
MNIEVRNASAFDIELGNDLTLIEANANGSMFDGTVDIAAIPNDESYGLEEIDEVFRKQETSAYRHLTTHLTYGLSSYRVNNNDGTVIERLASNYQVIIGRMHVIMDDCSMGTLSTGAVWKVPVEAMSMGAWLKQEALASVRLVFPEFVVRSGESTSRWRWMVFFSPTTNDPSIWEPTRQELVPIERTSLEAIVMAPESNPTSRLLALRWLVDADPKLAPSIITRAVAAERQGHLLALALTEMTSLAAPGLEAQALKLLVDDKTPTGIGARCTEYLGVRKAATAIPMLVSVAKSKEDELALAAIIALEAIGDEAAVQALLNLVINTQLSDPRLAAAARALGRLDSPATYAVLEEKARAGNDYALLALATAAPRQASQYFQELHATGRNTVPHRAIVLKALGKTGGDVAFTALLEELKAESARPKPDSSLTSAIVEALARIDSPAGDERLLALARQGSVLSLRVLAQSKRPEVRVMLEELATSKNDAVRKLALESLATNWPGESTALLIKSLDEGQAAQAIAIGLVRSRDRNAIPLALRILKHSDEVAQELALSALWKAELSEDLPRLADYVLTGPSTRTTEGLAALLIKRHWRDRKAIPVLQKKLATIKVTAATDRDRDPRYAYVRLLRHLADAPGTMPRGPSNYAEFSKTPDHWLNLWLAWQPR